MPNAAYSDFAGNSKAKEAAGGSKNSGGKAEKDGREQGKVEGGKADFKSVGSEPNEGAPTLKQNPGHIA